LISKTTKCIIDNYKFNDKIIESSTWISVNWCCNLFL